MLPVEAQFIASFLAYFKEHTNNVINNVRSGAWLTSDQFFQKLPQLAPVKRAQAFCYFRLMCCRDVHSES